MNEEHLQTVKKLIVKGAEKATKSLSSMLKMPIELDVVIVRWLLQGKIPDLYDDISEWGFDDLKIVDIGVIGELSGSSRLVFTAEDAEKIAEFIIGKQEGADIPDSAKDDIIKEIGNILINGLIGTLGNCLGIHLTYELPILRDENFHKLIVMERDVSIIFCKIRFSIKDMNINGNFILTFEVDDQNELVNTLEKDKQ